ncbi:tyrosine-type recombinase/integrase [Halosegnis longus]|uniref:tyrosine-type recombinase/integrase n=1 Tax=Halosegnis longus TaxID=2216012 RepID=UPI00096AC9C0|nr:site-specific integrase [Salella cibi]
MTLEPITPDRAVKLYLQDRENELAHSTHKSHRSRLSYFTDWCEQEGIENLNTITGRQLYEYRIWRRNDGDLVPVSEKGQMVTLRVFIRWAESIEAVDQDLHTKVQIPSLAHNEGVDDAILDVEQARSILDYLQTFEYASRRHVVFALLWHTMCRRSSVRALDVTDYNPDEQYLEVIHRPDTGTPLKNQGRGERYIALSEQMCELLDDWIETTRDDVVDDVGRHPLIATAQGRIHQTTVQNYVYCLTRPCEIAGDCPHDRDVETCEATEWQHPSKCPSSVSPHAVRRGAITHALSTGTPQQVVSDRANVSTAVLDKHYDARSKREKMESRREFVDSV